MLGSIQNQLRPPINDPVVTDNKVLTDIWFRYFNYLYQSLLAALQNGISVPTITTVQRDASAIYKQQRFIINSDTNDLQIYINGAWQNVTLTPA